MKQNSNLTTLKILSTARPSSTDPLLYDSFVHHLHFRSVYASLLTEYSNEGLQGDLASHWKASNNFKDWEFSLDPDRKFSNGDQITAEIVLKSLKRVALIQRKLNSGTALFKDLRGIKALISMKSVVEGFELQDGKILFHFDSPQVDFLHRISFGTYGIVHPNDYDSVTGDWIDAKRIIASGHYKLDEINENRTLISLNYPSPKSLAHNFHEIQFLHKVPESLKELDIIYGSSESLVIDDNFYFSSPIKSTIRYVMCGSWNLQNSPFHDLATRRYLRSQFYNFLNGKGLTVVRSFFPTSISGVKEIEIHNDNLSSSENRLNGPTLGISFLKIDPPKKSDANKSKYSYIEGFNDFLESLPKRYSIKLSTDENPILVRNKEFYTFDISMNFTGILIENPVFDVKFMFLSSEGIHLPDADGSIHAALETEKFDIQKINELIWDQAIVWPVNHLALGLWIRKDASVAMDSLNLSLPPVDFSFIQRK